MLSLEPVVATVGGILQIAFFLAIALFLFLVWRERRGDLEAWSEWNRKLFYAAVVLAVVAIGLAIGYGLPAEPSARSRSSSCSAHARTSIVRVWRIEHRVLGQAGSPGRGARWPAPGSRGGPAGACSGTLPALSRRVPEIDLHELAHLRPSRFAASFVECVTAFSTRTQ